MNPKSAFTMNKSDLLVKIAGLSEHDPRIRAVAATLDGSPAATGPAQPTSLRLFRPGEAARELGCSRPTLWRLTREKKITPIEIRRGSMRYPESELRRFVEGRP